MKQRDSVRLHGKPYDIVLAENDVHNRICDGCLGEQHICDDDHIGITLDRDGNTIFLCPRCCYAAQCKHDHARDKANFRHERGMYCEAKLSNHFRKCWREFMEFIIGWRLKHKTAPEEEFQSKITEAQAMLFEALGCREETKIIYTADMSATLKRKNAIEKMKETKMTKKQLNELKELMTAKLEEVELNIERLGRAHLRETAAHAKSSTEDILGAKKGYHEAYINLAESIALFKNAVAVKEEEITK